MRPMVRWIKQRDGATAIEYGLIVAGIALAVALAISTLGDNLSTFFYDDLAGALDRE